MLLCFSCLSSDRKFIPLIKVKYRQILRDVGIMFNADVDMICWECAAMVRRLHIFTQQALTAQQTLILHKRLNMLTKIQSISPLRKTTITKLDRVIVYDETKDTSEKSSNYTSRNTNRLKPDKDTPLDLPSQPAVSVTPIFSNFDNLPIKLEVDVAMSEHTAGKSDLETTELHNEVILKYEEVYFDDDLYENSGDVSVIGDDGTAIDFKPRVDNQGSDTNSEYEGGAPEPSTKEKLRTKTVHKKCVSTYSRQDFKPSETHSTDNESRRVSPFPIIDNIISKLLIEYEEVDNENPTIDHVKKPRQIIGVRSKTSAERGREFRARKAPLKQSKQQELDAVVEIATEDIPSTGPSEDNRVLAPSEIRTIEKRARSAEATRRWRQRKKLESSKKPAKTAAQRMREYRERKKLAKKILLKQQSDQDLDPIVSTSSSQRAGPSTINSVSAELTRIGNSQSQQQIEPSELTREYRERRNDKINIESNERRV